MMLTGLALAIRNVAAAQPQPTPTPDPLAIVGTLAFIIGGFCAYFLPAFIGRHKRNRWAIFWLNLLTGWTVIGWIASFIWALTVDKGAE